MERLHAKRSVAAFAILIPFGLSMVAGAIELACGLDIVGTNAAEGSDASGFTDSPGSSLPTEGEDIDANSIVPGDEVRPTNPELGDASDDASPIVFDAATDVGVDGGTGCTKPALVLGDVDSASTNGLSAALSEVGFTVTSIGDSRTYTGTPNANTFAVVVLLAGRNDGLRFQNPGEQSLAAAIQAGTTGFVTEEWADFNNASNVYDELEPFIIYDSTHTYYPGNRVTMRVNVPTGGTAHPIWDGLAPVWTTTKNTVVTEGQHRQGASTIARATIGGAQIGSGVVISETNGRRVAHTSLAVNYVTVNDNGLADDANVRKLYVNMALWAARCR